MLVRKPVVAGQFYELVFEKLDKQISQCFKSKFGPGDFPVERSNRKITYGLVSPHAGYQASGPAAAWAYKEIAESKLPSCYIILGPNHTGLATSEVSTTLANWETPFGPVQADRGFARELMGKCSFVKDDYKAHSNEHSIEVQLPFLQFVSKDVLRKIRIVPLIITDYDLQLCRDLADAIVDVSEDICVIASSDFTHYGPYYNYVPFSNEKKENMYKLDGEIISFVNKLDTKGFLECLNAKRATVCGAGAIAVCMEVMRHFGIKKGHLLNYYTSGDILNDYTNSVGYAAIKF